MGAESGFAVGSKSAPAGVAPSLVPWTFGRRSLVWPVTSSARGCSVPSQTPAHAAPVQPLPWLCRSRPSAAPSVTAPSSLAGKPACQPQPQTLALRSRAGSSAWLRWGGRALSAANAGMKGAPSSPRFQRVEGLAFRRIGSLSSSVTRHEPPRPRHHGPLSPSQAP